MKNLILVVFDCLRADFCFPKAPPYIEQLKAQGESYTQYISVATCTVPCFASMLTGLYPETHGIKGHPDHRRMITDDEWSLKKEVVTLPMILKKYGYHTYAEVSDPLIKQFHLDKGFDYYNVRDGRKINTLVPEYFDALKKLVDAFQEPYFFLLHLFDLHSGPSPAKFERQCKTLEELLKDKQKDTILVVTGDHGERQNEAERHGLHIKEHLVRVPLIISGKDIEPKTVSGQYSQVDLVHLILSKISVPINLPYKLPGSIKPRACAYVRAVGAPLREPEWKVGIRTECYKYVTHIKNEKAPDELYHLPKEERVSIEEHGEIVDELKNKLLEVMDQAGQLDLGNNETWTEQEEQLVLERLKKLGYIE